MKIGQHLHAALLAVLAGATCCAAVSAAQDSSPTKSLVIRGRVLSETIEPVPQESKDMVVIAARHTYRLRVERVISGQEKGPEIVALKDADGLRPLRADRDLVFHLVRRSDGAFNLAKVDD